MCSIQLQSVFYELKDCYVVDKVKYIVLTTKQVSL